MNSFTRIPDAEAPEVIPERLGRMPVEVAINKARYDFGTIAIKASADSSLPPHQAARLAEIETLAKSGEALLEAVLRAHWIAEGYAHLGSLGDPGAER